MEGPESSRKTLTGATWSCSTNTSMVTTGLGSGRATRLDGADSSLAPCIYLLVALPSNFLSLALSLRLPRLRRCRKAARRCPDSWLKLEWRQSSLDRNDRLDL